MLIELLSTSNYGQYNIKIASTIGLEPSIYLNEVLNLYEKAYKKSKLIEDEYFKVDRNYIKSVTTLSKEKQREWENFLVRLGFLSRTTEYPECVSVNLNAITTVMMGSNETLMKDIEKIRDEVTTKVDKTESTVNALMCLVYSADMTIRDAYETWIRSVLSKEGWMSRAAVTSATSNLNSFCKGNNDVLLKILEIASINGHRDINWSIENFKKTYNIHFIMTRGQEETPSQRKRLSNTEVF